MPSAASCFLITHLRESLATNRSADLDDEAECMALIEAIGRFGTSAQSAVLVLVAALDDQSLNIQQKSTQVLGKIGPLAAVAVDKLDQLLTEPPQPVPGGSTDESTRQSWRSRLNQTRTAIAEARCRIAGQSKDAILPRQVRSRQQSKDSDAFRRWIKRHGIKPPRYGAVGRHGSIAVVERLIKTLKDECTRSFGPLATRGFPPLAVLFRPLV